MPLRAMSTATTSPLVAKNGILNHTKNIGNSTLEACQSETILYRDHVGRPSFDNRIHLLLVLLHLIWSTHHQDPKVPSSPCPNAVAREGFYSLIHGAKEAALMFLE